MTSILDQAIENAKRGDNQSARNEMQKLDRWVEKYWVITAMVKYAHAHNLPLAELLKEMEDALAKISANSEITRGEEQAMYCELLVSIGEGDRAWSYARNIDEYCRIKAFVYMALAARNANKPFEKYIDEAGRLASEYPEPDNWLGQTSFRDAIAYSWAETDYFDDLHPYIEKYLTDPAVKKPIKDQQGRKK